MAKKNGISSNVKIVMFLALGLFVILFSLVISDPKYQSFRKPKAASLEPNDPKTTTVTQFWPTNLGRITLDHLNDGNCNPGGTNCTDILPTRGYLSLTQKSSNDYWTKYAAEVSPTVLNSSTTAEIRGRTTATCDGNMGFVLSYISDPDGNGVWDTSSTQQFTFGLLQDMDCYQGVDGMVYFRKTVAFTGAPTTAYGFAFAMTPGNYNSNKIFQITNLEITSVN